VSKNGDNTVTAAAGWRRERFSVVDVAPPLHLRRSLVMVGLMGAGKSAIGRRLAQRLDLPFVDADAEIEAAAGCSIGEIFERFGESYFRDGERRVIARLLDGPIGVVATGGGAFMDPETRARIREKGISVWLKADVETLSERVSRRTNRPLLKNGDPKAILTGLMERRYPIYAEADVVVITDSSPPAATVERVVAALADYLAAAPAERRP
jgi:shikimate kinase